MRRRHSCGLDVSRSKREMAPGLKEHSVEYAAKGRAFELVNAVFRGKEG